MCRFILIFLVSLSLVACSSSKRQIFNHDMPTMAEIYEEKFNHLDKEKPITMKDSRMRNEVRQDRPNTIRERLSKQFPKRDNPLMIIHVYAHLTDSGTPVPSYQTYFPLYSIDRFTLVD